MAGDGDEDCPVGFEEALAAGDPVFGECVVSREAHRAVPFSLIDGDHFPGMACNSAF